MSSDIIRISAEVDDALRSGRAVVALESTVFSQLGLPAPHNAEALSRCLAAVRDGGAVPAITAVVDGELRVGLEESEHDRVLTGEIKVSSKDLPVAMAQGLAFGATTVAASLTLATAAGIGVFATGGIGGVHREADVTGDVSADLTAIATHPVLTVTAGAKGFLDLAKTLEYLETLGVPVLGWRTNNFPAFWVADSGLELAHRVETAVEVARIAAASRSLGRREGTVLAVPVPEADALPASVVDPAIELALADAEQAERRGADVTPYVLAHVGQATAGRSVPTNLALAEHNARVAAEVAVELANL